MKPLLDGHYLGYFNIDLLILHINSLQSILKYAYKQATKQVTCNSNNTFDSVIDPLSLDGLILKPIKLFVYHYHKSLLPTLACQF